MFGGNLFYITFTRLKSTNETTAVLYKEDLNINQILCKDSIYTNLHTAQCYYQQGIKKLQPHPMNVLSRPLFHFFLQGVELKGSMTTSRALTQCVWGAKKGETHQPVEEGFLRTFIHWEILITHWLSAKPRKGTFFFSNARHFAKIKYLKRKMVHRATHRENSWPLGNFVHLQQDCFSHDLWFLISFSGDASFNLHLQKLTSSWQNTFNSLHPLKRLQWSAVGYQLRTSWTTCSKCVTWFTKIKIQKVGLQFLCLKKTNQAHVKQTTLTWNLMPNLSENITVVLYKTSDLMTEKVSRLGQGCPYFFAKRAKFWEVKTWRYIENWTE